MESQDKLRKLKDEMLHALTRTGGFAWETPRLNNGCPTIHFVWDGNYYGFFPTFSALSDKERTMMDKISKAGGISVKVKSIEQMEEALNLDITKKEIARLLPRKKIRELLKKWGRGEEVDPALEQAIVKLPKDYAEAMYAIHFDRMSYNQYAVECGFTVYAARRRHTRAINMLQNMLVKDFDVVDDHVLR